MRHWFLPAFKPFLVLRGQGNASDRLAYRAWEAYALLHGTLKPVERSAPTDALRFSRRVPTISYTADLFRDHIGHDLLPFWEAHACDLQHGGFITHLDRQGRVYDDSIKTAAMQARMVYGFAIGYELFGTPSYLGLAQHGFRFLVEHLWDKDHGGWYRDVYRDGRVRSPEKDLFNQAYVLLGLAEYYRVTRDQTGFDYAVKTFELLDRDAWDEQQFGYYEACSPDWGHKSDAKTICVELDMLTAVIALHAVTKAQIHLNRARQLADLIPTRMIDNKYGCLLERFRRDWIYDPAATHDQVSVGHNLKGAWLLLTLYRLTNCQDYLTAARRMLDYCLRYGWDTRHGGFYQHLFRNGVVARGEKIWWGQCEGMQALLLMHLLSGDAIYQSYFRQLADFSFANFCDREYGEWVTTCYPDGAALDTHKGGTWKAAYHTVQMCYTVHTYLASMQEPT